jgi:hypothetical protein
VERREQEETALAKRTHGAATDGPLLTRAALIVAALQYCDREKAARASILSELFQGKVVKGDKLSQDGSPLQLDTYQV